MQPTCDSVDALPDFNDVLEEAEQIIRQCFATYSLDEVFLCFNGGKDCTVLLDVTINVLKSIYKRTDIGKDLKVVYIRTKGPFAEIENFVKEIEMVYDLKLIVTEGEMKETLQRLLEKDSRLKAGLMGTRRSDPYSENMQFMQKTDPSWPQILRISPLLDWSYHQIWSYILQRQVPYCVLYDQGYTSVGSLTNTWPNPALANKDSFGCNTYLPAWRLSDGSLERAGRGSKPKLTVNGHDTCHNTLLSTINPCIRNEDVL